MGFSHWTVLCWLAIVTLRIFLFNKVNVCLLAAVTQIITVQDDILQTYIRIQTLKQQSTDKVAGEYRLSVLLKRSFLCSLSQVIARIIFYIVYNFVRSIRNSQLVSHYYYRCSRGIKRCTCMVPVWKVCLTRQFTFLPGTVYWNCGACSLGFYYTKGGFWLCEKSLFQRWRNLTESWVRQLGNVLGAMVC